MVRSIHCLVKMRTTGIRKYTAMPVTRNRSHWQLSQQLRSTTTRRRVCGARAQKNHKSSVYRIATTTFPLYHIVIKVQPYHLSPNKLACRLARWNSSATKASRIPSDNCFWVSKIASIWLVFRSRRGLYFKGDLPSLPRVPQWNRVRTRSLLSLEWQLSSV